MTNADEYANLVREGIFRNITLSGRANSEGRKDEAVMFYAVARMGYFNSFREDSEMWNCLNDLEKTLNLPLTMDERIIDLAEEQVVHTLSRLRQAFVETGHYQLEFREMKMLKENLQTVKEYERDVSDYTNALNKWGVKL